MSGTKKGNFSFRMSADDANTVVNEFRKVAQGSDQLKAAFDRLIQASPQLASVNDGVQRKMRETADGMKQTQAAGTSLAGVMGRAGVLGFAIGAGTQAFESLVQSVKDTYEAIPKAGDEVKQLTARLTNVTGSAELASQAYAKLAGVARATGAPLTETVDTFQRMSIAAKDLGASTDQVIRLVEGVQKFGVVSGASPQALGAAAQQLGQALASGKLQGDELRSIMENMPELAQALARELNVSMGALRQMGSEGKLQSDVVFPALLRAVEGIDEKFKAMPLTIERGMNAAGTASTQLLGHVDKLLGLSTSIANKWQSIADLMDRARRFLGGGTEQETLADLEAERITLEQERARLGRDAEVRRSAGIGQLGGFDDDRRARDIDARLVAIREQQQGMLRDQRELARTDRAASLASGREGAAARSREELKDILDLNPITKATRERDERMAALERGLRLGTVSDQQYRETAKIIRDDYTKAISESTGAVEKHTEAVADMLKQRDEIEKTAAQVELALDPFAAAWQKTADQVKALTDAMQLWEDSAGARGMDPARATELIQRAQEGLIETSDKLARGVEKADNTFQQFFSNATSGFEDAIVRGERFGDIVKGLEQDIARLLLRSFVTGPLVEGVSGFVKDSGGLGGLAKAGFNWLTSLFADGGIMTDRGPLPLRRYASGGIADTPQLAMFGEGRTPEAYVPLPDGRRIPVAMQGGSRGDTNVTVNVGGSNASPQLIAATVAMAVEESQRRIYGDADRGGAAAKKLGRRK